MNLLFKLIFIIPILFIISCRQEFDDLSLKKKYSHLIAQDYITTKVLKLHGVTSDDNYAKKISHYSLTKPPGIGGPEIIFEQDLIIGNRFRVKKILKCNNCVLGAPTVILIEILTDNYLLKKPIRLYGLKEDKNGRVELDTRYFKKTS